MWPRRRKPTPSPTAEFRELADRSLTPEEQENVAHTRRLARDLFDHFASESWQRTVERHGDPSDIARLPGSERLELVIDPIRRDLHLQLLDIVGLPLLRAQRLTYEDLRAVAKQRKELALAAQDDLLPVPILWRWILDAYRRRMIQPAVPTESPTAGTAWDVTEKGERWAVEQEGFLPWANGIIRRHTAGSLALLGAGIALFGAAGVRHAFESVAFWLLYLFALSLVAGVVVDWLQRRRRRYDQFEHLVKKGETTPVEWAVWREAVIQRTAAERPEFPRWWLELAPPSAA